MDQAVQDRVGDGGVTDDCMSLIYGELGGYDGGASVIAVVDNFEEIPGPGGSQGSEPPVIVDEQGVAGQASKLTSAHG